MMRFLKIIGVAFPLVTAGCVGNDMDPLERCYKALQAIPREQWAALAQKRIYFGHQSVGQNILDGLKKVLQSRPSIHLNIQETANPADFRGPVLAHSPIGQNKNPKGKIDDFKRILESGIGNSANIAFFKLCYADIEQTTDIDDLIGYFDKTVAELSKKYPALIIIPVTVPLTNTAPGIRAWGKRLLGRGPDVQSDNIKRNLVNVHIRKKYVNAVWDLADAQATTVHGTKVVFHNAQGTFFLMNPDYTSDGGHLNTVGSQVLAINLLLRLVASGPP